MSWEGIPPSGRVCHGCGEKLTLAHSLPLWFEGDSLVWHFACKLKAMRG